jgi:hypothetical protein
MMARQYDEAIAVCQKLANENPNFALAHFCLAWAYWGKRMYPQVIEERNAFGKLSGDRRQSEFASALEQGFRSGGWKGALAKGIEIRQRNARTDTFLRTTSPHFMPTWETTSRPSSGSTPLIRSAIGCC